MGAGGMAAAIIIASSMVNATAAATIARTPVTATAGVTVTAADDAAIASDTSLQAEVAPTNDLGAGILNRFVGQILGEYQFTTHSGTRLVALRRPRARRRRRRPPVMGTDATLDLAAQDFTDFGLWKTLTEPNLLNDAVTYAALSALGTALKREALGSADVYFGLVDHNDVRSAVTASIDASPITAAATCGSAPPSRRRSPPRTRASSPPGRATAPSS